MHSPFTLLMMSVTLSSQTGGGQWLPFLPEWLEIAIFLFAIIFVPVGLVILFVGMWRKVLFTIWYVISLQPLRRALLRFQLSRRHMYLMVATTGQRLQSPTPTSRRMEM